MCRITLLYSTALTFSYCLKESEQQKTTLRGVQFMFKTQEGVSWIMFSSEPMNLVYDNIQKTTISSTAPFTGVIWVAYIPAKDQSDTSTEALTGLHRLIYHAGVYPIGGQVSWDFHSSPSSFGKGLTPLVNNTSRYATVHFTYTTRTMIESSLRPNAATNGLLMLALPHHAQLLPKSVLLNWKHFDLSYRCIKGSLTPVVGSTW